LKDLPRASCWKRRLCFEVGRENTKQTKNLSFKIYHLKFIIEEIYLHK
jgi:hypothetical protein